jgi:hypothetical protein
MRAVILVQESYPIGVVPISVNSTLRHENLVSAWRYYFVPSSYFGLLTLRSKGHDSLRGLFYQAINVGDRYDAGDYR